MMERDKMAKRPSFGGILRRRLADVTNSLPQTKSPVILENLPQDTVSAKEYIDHLLKEKAALVKHIQDKNKIIEVTGNEIQNMRACLQKMQMQNWSLAKSNSLMLAELNLGKERLKELQHEVACKEALLKTKNLDLKGQEKVNVEKKELKKGPVVVVANESECKEESKTCNVRRRGRPSRSQSLGSSVVPQPHAEKEPAVCKRRCVRRRSTSSRVEHEELTENLFEIDEAKFPIHEDGLSLLPMYTEKEENDGNRGSKYEVEESRRMSTGRPLRKAAVKVQSYKEKPVNVKMRRSE